MKKLLLACITGGMLLTMAACGSNNNTSDKSKNESNTAAGNGEQLFKQSCSSCHGGNLEGNIGPNLQKVGAKYSEKQIEGIIHNGRGAMPNGVLQGSEAKSVAEWLATKK